MAAGADAGRANGRPWTTAPTHLVRAREGGPQPDSDHFIYLRTAVGPDRTGDDAAPDGGAHVADRPLADGRTLPLEHVVRALATRKRTFYERFVKPVIDRVATALLLPLFLPVLLLTALAVWISLGSPILVRQARVGRDGSVFHMFKFRTMRPDRRQGRCPDYCGPERRVTHKSPHDPRHTSLGRKLRKTSLDELPQLFNVLRGEMSLVGPRPELVDIVARYDPWQHARHAVKPGITGLWQVTERPNGGPLHEHTELDLAYIECLSFRSDLKILLKTPFALLRRNEVV